MDIAYAASYHKDHDLFVQHRKMELSGIELEILLQFGRNSHQFTKFKLENKIVVFLFFVLSLNRDN